MKAVLDTNVVVSGIIREEGPSGQILRLLLQEGKFTAVTSVEILAEIRQVLLRPKIRKYHGWTDEQIDTFVTFLYTQSLVTEGKLPVNVARDPSDNKFLSCAREANVEYLVSADDDLLELKTYEGTAIVSPAAFLDTLKSS